MRYSFKLPNKAKTKIDVEIAFFTGQHTVWINGEKATPVDRKKKLYEIVSKKNRRTLRLRPNVIDLGLTVYFGDREIQVTPRLSGLDYLFAYLPFGIGMYFSARFDPSLVGGIIIGILSILISFLNVRLFRSKHSTLVKNAVNILICAGSYGVYYLVYMVEGMLALQ